jgi:hypothetical protein
MKRVAFTAMLLTLLMSVAVAQSTPFRSPKKPGHYTTQDWRALIDSLWGPGLPTSTKLEIFDTFWGRIDREWGGFPHLNVNWDSLKALYRPEVEAGVSRGRFAGITTALSAALQEMHTGTLDTGIDTVNGYSARDLYLPGVPHFYPSGWGWAGSFGAALTPLPDSSLLVYRAVTPHPLGLVPGDVVLGYDRIPWKRLYRELLEAELPVQISSFGGGVARGSTPRSWIHGLLTSAGNHWGLYDTIDVVKYVSGDTLHLPTTPLAGQDRHSLFATEQVAVPGVRMPDFGNNELVTWGVIDKTSIGYVYTYSWANEATAPFAAAIRDLVVVKNVSGLILDFRGNRGGSETASSAGLDLLYNQNPAGPTRWREAVRSATADHLGFSYVPPFDDSLWPPDSTYYDGPIAVLLGPQASSAADYTAFRMRFHPMGRSFGLPTNGGFVAGTKVEQYSAWGTWYYGFWTGQMVSLLPNEGFLIHRSFPVDEEVWLTRDGVAMGKDDVVERALAWISTLTHAHGVKVGRRYVRPGLDSVVFTAVLANPLSHTAILSATVTDASGSVRDSVMLHNDGQHGDGTAGDSLWGSRIRGPSGEGVFGVNVRTSDITQSTYRFLPNAAMFTTTGPVIVDSTRTQRLTGENVRVDVWLRSSGKDSTIPAIIGVLRTKDPNVKAILSNTRGYGALAPGERRMASYAFTADTSIHNADLVFTVEVSSNGIVYWVPEAIARIRPTTGVIASDSPTPGEYGLEQNYPNPFNPVATIEYAVGGTGGQELGTSPVKLAVFDLLGREVALLVYERKSPGRYRTTFDGAGLPSGIYVYRMSAGGYSATRRMILMK